MCSSTTAERQSLASRDRTCCPRRCLPAPPPPFYGFRGSIAHPTQSLCTLRTRRRRRPRNTRYRAPATAYPDRSLTGRSTPASLAHKQSILSFRDKDGLLRFARNDELIGLRNFVMFRRFAIVSLFSIVFAASALAADAKPHRVAIQVN